MNGMVYYFCCGARQTAENRKRTQRSNFRRYNTDYSRRQLMLLSPLYIAVCCIVVLPSCYVQHERRSLMNTIMLFRQEECIYPSACHTTCRTFIFLSRFSEGGIRSSCCIFFLLSCSMGDCWHSHVSSKNQSRCHRTSSSHSGAEEYSHETIKQTQRRYTYSIAYHS